MSRLFDGCFCAENDNQETGDSPEKLRVLIVEDDIWICQMIRALVVDLGHTVVG